MDSLQHPSNLEVAWGKLHFGKDIDVPTIIIGISDAITEFSDATLATMPNILIYRRLTVATIVATVARETTLLPPCNPLIINP